MDINEAPNFEEISKHDISKLYSETYANIRETDQISFKLLSYVPFVAGSGAGFLSFLLTNDSIEPLPVILISALGAFVTFSFYRWERRNIQTCDRLIERAEVLEQIIGFGQLSGKKEAPKLLGKRIGKTQAESFIYTASVIAWLIPIIIVYLSAS